MVINLHIAVFIAILLGCVVVSGAIAFFAGVSHRKKVAELQIGSAEQEAKRIVSEALKTAEAKKFSSIIQRKESIRERSTDV